MSGPGPGDNSGDQRRRGPARARREGQEAAGAEEHHCHSVVFRCPANCLYQLKNLGGCCGCFNNAHVMLLKNWRLVEVEIFAAFPTILAGSRVGEDASLL